MQTVLGIDLGTQALKVLFYDPAAREVRASASAELEIHRKDDGTAEQQAHWWTAALKDALAKVPQDIRRSAVGIGVSGQQHGFVALDCSGETLTPVKLWCDTSTTLECEEIMAAFGGEQDCLGKVGNLIYPGYTASKIRWMASHRSDLYEQLDCILLPHDYLNFVLTGEQSMEMGDASGSGFLDIRKRTWSLDMLKAIDPDRDLIDCLPDLHPQPTIIGRVQKKASEEFGLPEGIPVASGGGDNMMGAIGTGNLSAGKLTMSLGTSGTVYAHSDFPVIDPQGEIAAFCSSAGAWLPLLCTMNCTVTTELMRKLLKTDIAGFEYQVSKAPRGSGGIITLPFFNGERTPNLPREKASILGLDSHNTQPENLLRSALEGATFALRYGIDRLFELGITASEIVVTGGGMKSATWRQVVADVCDTPVTVLQQDEGASFGAALQALSVLDGQKSDELAELAQQHLSKDADRSCEPNRDGVQIYQDSYQSYRSAVNTLAGYHP